MARKPRILDNISKGSGDEPPTLVEYNNRAFAFSWEAFMPMDSLVLRSELRIAKNVLALGFDSASLESEVLDACDRLVDRVNSLRNGVEPTFVVLDCRSVERMRFAILSRLRSTGATLLSVSWRLLVVMPEGVREERCERSDPFQPIYDIRHLSGAIEALEEMPWPPQRPTPEMIASAREDFSEAEFIAGLEEIERTGGFEFKDILHELERNP